MRLIIICQFALLTAALAPLRSGGSPPAESLPKIVLIGDSIREGYTPDVVKRCTGRAEIVSAEKFGQNSDEVLDHLSLVISAKPDMVHFNCGLRDLAKSKKTDRATVPLDRFERNLKQIVSRLRKETSAKLIFATITPVIDALHAQRQFEFNRCDSDVKRYNDVAIKVMKNADVEIDDLNQAIRQRYPDKLISGDGVHYSSAGYEVLGEKVAGCILTQVARTKSN